MNILSSFGWQLAHGLYIGLFALLLYIIFTVKNENKKLFEGNLFFWLNKNSFLQENAFSSFRK